MTSTTGSNLGRWRVRAFAALFGMVATATVAFVGWRLAFGAPRLNVLMVTLDTTRADRIGCYGHQGALTPALDGLAREGVLFEQARTPVPLTLPAHASLLTGLLPPEHGLITNGRGALGAGLSSLAEVLTDAGYDCGAFVGSFVLHSKFGLDQGFDVYDDDLTNTDPTEHGLHRQREGQRVVDRALEWLGLPRRKPTFCWVHLYDAHFPYKAHEDAFGDRFQDRPYDAELAWVDRQIQRLLDDLDRRGLRQNTVVIIVGDHGESLGEHDEEEHSLTLYDAALRVPLLISGPGVASGRRVPQPVSLVDIRPTLLATLGLRDPATVTGRSLRPALLGKEIEPGDSYAGTDDPLLEYGWCPLRSLTSGGWKYIRSTENELYDLSNDPGETTNLADAERDRAGQLEVRLASLEKRMTRRASDVVQLTPQERKALTSLGYLGGSKATAASEGGGAALPDVKRMLPIHNTIREARQLVGQSKPAEAEALLRRRLDPAGNPPEAGLDKLRIVLAESMIAQRMFADARTLLDDVLARNPEESDAQFHLGVIETAENRPDEAARRYLAALEIKPDAEGVLYNLALNHSQQGRFDEADEQYRKVLAIDPAHVNANIGLGVTLAARQRFDEAIKHYRRALAYDAGAVEAHSNLAIILASAHQASEAKLHFAKAAEIAPNNPETRFNYGTFLMVTGEAQRAIVEFEAAVRLKPDHAVARERLQRLKAASQ